MKKVVILEDDLDFGRNLLRVFEMDSNLQVVGNFSKIQDLLDNMTALKPDLFWLDIHLPDGLSIASIPKIKEEFPDSQCLICSLHDDDEFVFDALKFGADGYLLKNSKSDEILKALEELINGGSPMNPYIARKVLSAMRQKPAEVSENNLIKSLTERELQMLESIAQGFLYKEIADQHFISYETVKKHLQNIYKKLHVQNRSEAIIMYLNKGQK
jgi:two-component system, NarL family, response regulator LiaR